jgi:hypothetical protein
LDDGEFEEDETDEDPEYRNLEVGQEERIDNGVLYGEDETVEDPGGDRDLEVRTGGTDSQDRGIPGMYGTVMLADVRSYWLGLMMKEEWIIWIITFLLFTAIRRPPL